jgi:hypothetical protein
MTIKIKAPVVWLEEADVFGIMSSRLNEREKKFRVVSESDWRKLMALVKAAEKFNEHHMIYEALKSLEKKK